ncbi:MAG: insulinase family protein [Hyphomicrobiaceae bacterium]|nr:insulinase family protein [Hyphomicrobiaceae bacterium]
MSWPGQNAGQNVWLGRMAGAATAVVSLVMTILTLSTTQAAAMKIETVKSPGGIEAWLVTERSVPMMALRFAFIGGSSQDPVGKDGTANFLTAMLDEGAGDLDSTVFQQRMEEIAMRMSFEDGKDTFYGNFQTLTVNRDKARDLLKLALTKPRFDAEAVERIRKQLLAGLIYAERDPEKVASRAWYEHAFNGHPYARPTEGTKETLAAIDKAALESYRKKVFAKSNLKVVAVGDIDAAELGAFLDAVFGDLAAKAELAEVPKTMPMKGAMQKIVEMNVPQSVAVFGLPAMMRKDPDFMTAFVMNQILGGGGFASRLMEEVREKRGLAYSVFSYIQPFQHTSVFAGGVATKNEEINQSLEVIKAELKRMADSGPTESELANAKSYLTGSYALRFDTNAKIASQLLGLQVEGFDKDYIKSRNAQIEAVTMPDVKRVAAKLLKSDELIVTIVGKPMMPDAQKSKEKAPTTATPPRG